MNGKIHLILLRGHMGVRVGVPLMRGVAEEFAEGWEVDAE